jgi:hypothetical protein
MKFRKKPVVIEATQWFKNGNHPEDNCFRPFEDTGVKPDQPREGAVVRYFRRPDVSGTRPCISSIPCAFRMHDHGWIDTPEGGHTVCPGDWVITGVENEKYPCKPNIFEKTYEKIEE